MALMIYAAMAKNCFAIGLYIFSINVTYVGVAKQERRSGVSLGNSLFKLPIFTELNK